jgi:hypothetical protein
MKLGVFTIDFEIEVLRKIGVETLIFPFNTKKEILKEAEREFQVCLEFKPFEGGIIENIFGEKTRLNALGCPSSKELREKNLQKLKNIEYEVIMDFIRYPSPSNKEYFYTCFCKECYEKARELGYNLNEIKMKIKKYLEKDDVNLLNEWFEFRKEVIKDYLEMSKLKYAFFFTPSLSILVGQDYNFNLKKIHPMIYLEPIGPACIEYEMKNIRGKLKEMIMRNLEVEGEEVIKKEFEKALKSKAEIEPIVIISENIKERLEMLKKAKKVHIFAYSKNKKNLFLKLMNAM